jgi:hypothetical protein
MDDSGHVQPELANDCTLLRDTLKSVKTVHRNVTLSLPEPLLRRFRVYAATRNQSMTALTTEAVKKMLAEQSGVEAANRRFLDRIRNAPDRGIGEKIPRTRDELHQR